MWQRIINQRRVKEILRVALEKGRIAHAYLFYGNEGAGKDAMALEFARVLNCEKGGVEACNQCSSCKAMGRLQHPNVKLIFPLPREKSEDKSSSPLDGLSPETVEEIQEQLKLKAENPYYRIQISEAKEIRITSIRELRRQAALSKFLHGKKVFILSNAEYLNEEASNALLKTLEEPLADTVLILTTSHPERLLPTIVSRCQRVKFDPLSGNDIQTALVERVKLNQEQAYLVAKLSNGSYTRALELLGTEVNKKRNEVVQFVRLILAHQTVKLSQLIEELVANLDRQELEEWLVILLIWFRDALILREGAGNVINVDQAEDLRRFISKFPNADLHQAILHTEHAIALLRKNVYLPLIFFHLAVELKQAILHQEAVVQS